MTAGQGSSPTRLLLAVDASAAVPGVALHGPQARGLRRADGETGSEGLLRAAAELLEAQGLALRDLAGLALGAGPGSFTGLRVAVAMVQALAWARSLPVLPVSTLAVAAARGALEAGLAPGREIWVLRDARMGDAYLGRYRLLDLRGPLPGVEALADDAMVRLAGPRLAVPDGTLVLGDVAAAPCLDPVPIRHTGPARCDPEGIAAFAARVWTPQALLAAEAVRPVYLRERMGYRRTP